MSPAALALTRLVAELRADLSAAQSLREKLEPWANKLADADESLFPAALLHHFYTAIETFLGRSIRVFEGDTPGGAGSHAQLLHLAARALPGVRPEIISPEQQAWLRELLDFRHFFRHGYAAVYRAERLRELALLATLRWDELERRLEEFVTFCESCARPG